MTCPYCAEEIADDVQFCPKCGTQLGVPVRGFASPGAIPPLPSGVQPPTSGKAIGSLICGIFFFFLPASVTAVILGHLSLSEIRKSAGRLGGQGLATAGLVLGYVGLAILPILIIAAIAIPNLIRSRMAANESSAVGALRSYSYALGSYVSECPQIGFPSSLAKLGPGRGCNHAGLLDGSLGQENPRRSGYEFNYTPGAPDNLGQVTSFMLTAEPLQPGTTGQRSFFVDQTGVVRASDSGTADADSPSL